VSENTSYGLPCDEYEEEYFALALEEDRAYRAFPIDNGGELEPEELGDSDLPF